MRYTASLINILTVYSMQSKGRFIYFSSQEVFSSKQIDPFPIFVKPVNQCFS